MTENTHADSIMAEFETKKYEFRFKTSDLLNFSIHEQNYQKKLRDRALKEARIIINAMELEMMKQAGIPPIYSNQMYPGE